MQSVVDLASSLGSIPAYAASDTSSPALMSESAVLGRLASVESRALNGEFSGSDLIGGPVIYHYPAVMMPELQRAVLSAIAPDEVDPIRTLDPFVGSGTTMCEATLRGFPFVGVDINPLAILVSRVKAGPFHLGAFRAAAEHVSRSARRSTSEVRVEFPSRDKWYRQDVQIELTRLRNAIEQEGHAPTRRFLWVILAETARLCSNSRLTTVKLHMRKVEQLDRPIRPIDVFDRVFDRSISGFEDWCAELAGHGRIKSGNWLQSEVALVQGDIRSESVLDGEGPKFSLVLTSPPYGDNRSTIPYGEASYLPTQWIDPQDLSQDVPDNAFVVDARSLGGSRIGASEAIADLKDRSVAFAKTAEALLTQPNDRLKRVATFVRDLDEAIQRIHGCLGRGAWQVWTVGSRTVGGVLIPLPEMLGELQAERDVRHVATLTRPLPARRRAAERNDRAPRMRDEQVLVFRNS